MNPNDSDQLQARYDRLVAYRGRLIRYHDDCPDGDPRKARVEKQITDVGRTIVSVEAQLDAAIEATSCGVEVGEHLLEVGDIIRSRQATSDHDWKYGIVRNITGDAVTVEMRAPGVAMRAPGEKPPIVEWLASEMAVAYAADLLEAKHPDKKRRNPHTEGARL